ncbi:MAG: signal recognition particle-docking protein FtsY [Actinomycetota bacterium]|nr:signal recognition particle-docking protein FtsY [Actinomycetota bacterium]
MHSAQIILLLVVVVLVVGGVAFVGARSRRRGARPEPPAPLSSPRTSAPPAQPAEKVTARPTQGGLISGPEPAPEELDLHAEEKLAPEAPATIQEGLRQSRRPFAAALQGLFKRNTVEESFWGEVEDSLILSDVGLDQATRIVEAAKERVRRERITDPAAALGAIRAAMLEALSLADRSLSLEGERPVVWLFVGVNGVGKTTTIGKVAHQMSEEGRSVMLAAADTFRAAAADQLGLWAERAGADVVRGAPGGDPAAVLFDAISSARAKGTDVVLGDTAGRLQNKTNLIEELKKIYRTVEKAQGTLGEVLLVLDATVGQNGLAQAKVFSEAVGVTGVVLTKLDGSAKGGIAFAIEETFKIPVKLVGVGERIGDLIPFDPKAYVESLTALD